MRATRRAVLRDVVVVGAPAPGAALGRDVDAGLGFGEDVVVDLVAAAGGARRVVAEEASPVASDDRVIAEDQAGRLVELTGVATGVVVEEVAFDLDVPEGALLEEQRLV